MKPVHATWEPPKLLSWLPVQKNQAKNEPNRSRTQLCHSTAAITKRKLFQRKGKEESYVETEHTYVRQSPRGTKGSFSRFKFTYTEAVFLQSITRLTLTDPALKPLAFLVPSSIPTSR